jgi:hypothetical protein
MSVQRRAWAFWVARPERQAKGVVYWRRKTTTPCAGGLGRATRYKHLGVSLSKPRFDIVDREIDLIDKQLMFIVRPPTSPQVYQNAK